MTEISIRRVTDDEACQPILKFFTYAIMALMLFASIELLSWAVDNKLASATSIATNDITAEVRERQLGCLAKNVYYEAGSEPFEGKVAVAQVTLNRANSSQFPEDVCKVIYQKNVVNDKIVCQFSWLCDRVTEFKPINKSNYDESMIAAKKVLLENYRLPSLQKAMYFHGDYINPGWKKQPVAKIGRHIFYD
jgi:hypothetical protein